MVDIDSILLALRTSFFILWQFICYYCGRERYDCVKNIALFLSSYNIVYSKIFQSLSSGADVLTHKEMDYLSRFNDDVPYNATELYTIDELENNINEGRSADEMIMIDRSNGGHPIASGMIAVVYYGEIGDKQVVIKVKRKNIESRLREAINKMRLLVWVSTWLPFIKIMNLYTVFKENEEDMYKQVDFTIEANNIKTMGQNFQYTTYVKIPEVYLDITNKNNEVIVMERLYGKRLKELDNSVKNDYGRLVAQYSLKAALFDLIYHADLHSGNIFFMEEDGVKKLGIIDLGIVGHVTRDEQYDFYQFFEKVFLKNEALEAAKIIATRLVAPKTIFEKMNDKTKQSLYNDMATVIQDILDTNQALNVMTIYRINRMLYKYNLQLDRPFCRIQLSLAVSGSVSNELSVNGETYVKHIGQALAAMIKDTDDIMEMDSIDKLYNNDLRESSLTLNTNSNDDNSSNADEKQLQAL